MPRDLNVVDKYVTSSRLYSAIESTFAHWADVPDMKHESAHRSYIEAISQNNSRFHFFKETQRYLAQFRNGHTEFVDLSVFEQGDITLGLYARLIDKKWVVTDSVYRDVNPGDSIVRVDGVNAAESLKYYDDFISASRDSYKGYILWRRPFFLPETIEIELESGVTKQISKGRPPHAPRAVVEFRNEYTMPVVCVRSFDAHDYEDAALALLNQYRDEPYLVLDIRGNGGGNTPEKLIKALMNQPYPTWREASSFRVGVDLATQQLQNSNSLRAGEVPRFTLSWNCTVQQPEENAYNGKLFILHDIGTKSAAEDFLLPFKATARAVLVGETTSGSSGQPYIETPFPDAMFTVGAKRQEFPNGDRFEGIGISPDIAIFASQANTGPGTDFVLKELLKLI